MDIAERLEKIDAVHFRHTDIGDHHIEITAMLLCPRQRGEGRGKCFDFQPRMPYVGFVQQFALQRGQNEIIVVQQQDAVGVHDVRSNRVRIDI